MTMANYQYTPDVNKVLTVKEHLKSPLVLTGAILQSFYVVFFAD